MTPFFPTRRSSYLCGDAGHRTVKLSPHGRRDPGRYIEADVDDRGILTALRATGQDVPGLLRVEDAGPPRGLQFRPSFADDPEPAHMVTTGGEAQSGIESARRDRYRHGRSAIEEVADEDRKSTRRNSSH